MDKDSALIRRPDDPQDKMVTAADAGIDEIVIAPGIKVWLPQSANGKIGFVFIGVGVRDVGLEPLAPYAERLKLIRDRLGAVEIKARFTGTPFFRPKAAPNGGTKAKESSEAEALEDSDAFFIGPISVHMDDETGRLTPGNFLQRLLALPPASSDPAPE